MARLLESKFTVDDIGLFADFHCGDLPHETPLATWIKEKAVPLLKEKSTRTRIWKYQLDDATRAIVGYGSLNLGVLKGSLMEWGPVDRIKIQILPTMAVDSKHQGNGYGHDILECLIAQAVERMKTATEVKPLLGLAVNPKQLKAVKTYKGHGFEDFEFPIPCSYTGDVLQYMIRKLK